MAYKLSPEFADGCSNLICKDKDEALTAIESWLDEAVNYPNEPATIEFVEMSDKEIDNLPEF